MTRHPTFVRAMAWCRLAESVAGALTQPRADHRSVDADVEQLVRESAMLRGLQSGGAALHRGWRASRLRRMWIDGVDVWHSLDRGQAMSAIAVTVVVASALVLILQALRAP